MTKRSKVPQGKSTKGRVLTCACQPPTRRLKNGDILTPCSDLALQEMSPFAIVDALEAEWRRT